MRYVSAIARALLIIGGLNWGLVGFFEYNLVGAIFGGDLSTVSRVIYALVGLSAVYEIFNYPRRRRLAERETTLRRAA